MSDAALERAELVVRAIAQAAVDNETYFCELDAVVGDGDFGYSLARGFEIVLADWDAMEYVDAGGLLKKTAIVLSKHRRDLGADLGDGVPARRRGVERRGRPGRRGGGCRAASGDRGNQAARGVAGGGAGAGLSRVGGSSDRELNILFDAPAEVPEPASTASLRSARLRSRRQ